MTDSLSPLWHLEVLGQMRLTRLDATDADAAAITRFRSRKTAARRAAARQSGRDVLA